jgi:hypothetical protein
MEPRGLLSCSQEPSSDPYPVRDESSAIGSNVFLLRHVLILSFHLRVDLPSSRFLSGLPSKTLYAFLFFHMRAVYPAHIHLLDLINPIIFVEE